MEALEKQTKKSETNILHKSGNIHELLKAGKNSNINFDISRLSGKGFSNLLEKAKKLQEIKVKEDKSILETKKEELDSIIKKGKDTLKKNNISLTKIPDNFEMLKKFSQRISSRKPNNKINNILNSTDTQNNIKEDNYYGITTTANTNTNSNINSNFNTEKTKTKESIDIGNESKNEKEKDKDNDESSIDNIKRTERNSNNMEKRKYFHFYSIFNNLSSKNNNKINIKPKLKPRNKNITILNPDSIYQKSDNIDNIEENDKKKEEKNDEKNDENDNDIDNNSIKYIDENDINDYNDINNTNCIDNNDNMDNFDNNKSNNKYNDKKLNKLKYNNYNNISNKQNNSNIYEYQPGPSPSSTYYVDNDLDNNNSYENENNEKNNDSENYVKSNNNYKIYQNNNIKNTTEDLRFENVESDNNDNNDNKEEDNNSKENILNFDEDENNNDIIDIESKGIEYETVNSSYSIKQCNTVLEYSFREDQNISYCSLMEDKSKSIENFNNNKKQMLFQLFDGYKGEEIPNFLQQNFTHIYKQYLDETKQNIPRSLVKTFKETDEIIKKLPNIEGKCSTGTVIHIIWENKNKLMVYSGNVGNTKACLVSPVYVIKLTEDQETPEIKYIKMKLKNKKNKNYKNYKINNENKNEENSKVFGNYKFNEEDEEKEKDIGHKKYFKNRIKQINNNNNNEESEKNNNNKHCVPYISKMEIDLSIKNQFLFLGSDGIWDRIDEDELHYLIENNQDTEQLCSIIVKNVLRRDTTKNISIFVIKLT